MLSEFILSSLTNPAQNKVKIEVKDYTTTLDGVTYNGGGMFFLHISNLTHPNNDRLAEGFFEQLKIIHIKNF